MISALVFHIKSDIINKQQATSNKQQATSNKQQATSNKQQFLQYLKSSFLKVLFLFDTITIAASFGRVFTCLNEAAFLSQLFKLLFKLRRADFVFDRLLSKRKSKSGTSGSNKLFVKVMDVALTDGGEERFYKMFGDICGRMYVEHVQPVYHLRGGYKTLPKYENSCAPDDCSNEMDVSEMDILDSKREVLISNIGRRLIESPDVISLKSIDTAFLTTTTNVSAEIAYRISNDFLSVKNIHFVSELLFSSGLSNLI